MAQQCEPELDDPAYSARWRLGIASAYIRELQTRADRAGIAHLAIMRAKIEQAEADEQAAQAEVQKFL